MKQPYRTCILTSAFLLLLLLCGQAALTKAQPAWNIQTVDSTGDVGYSTSLVLDSSGNPHISYIDDTNSDLKYAKWTGTTWNIQTVDATGTDGYYYVSLALDSAGNPHISYCDMPIVNGERNYDLKYAKWTGSAWNIQTVDSAENVGWFNSIALDSSGNPHISYYDMKNGTTYFDVTDGDLKYAKWTGSVWNIQTVDSTGDVGSGTSIVLDSGNNPHISYCDVTNGDLKYAVFVPPQTSTPTSTNTNPAPSPSIPEFPQTIMLLTVAAMALIVTMGLVAYRKRNSHNPAILK